MSETQLYYPVLELDPQDLQVEESTRLFDAMRNRSALYASGAILVASLAGCSSESNPDDKTPVPAPSATQSFDVSKECGNGNRNDIASEPSIYPKLSSTKTLNGKVVDVLLPVAEAEDTMKAYVAKNPEKLAITYTYAVETADTFQLPDAGTLDRAAVLEASIKKDPKLYADVLKKTCAVLSRLVPEEQFAVTRGQATTVEVDTSPTANVYSEETITTTGNLRGFKLDYIKDDSDLTEEQRGVREKLSTLLLFTEGGGLALNDTFGPNSIRINQNQKTAVKITLKDGQLVVVKPNETKGDVETGSKDKATDGPAGSKASPKTSTGGSTGGTNGPTGDKGTTTGSTPEKNDGPAGGNTPGAGNIPEAAPGGTDNTPGAGPGTGGGEAPAPGPGTGGGDQPAPGPGTAPAPGPGTAPAPGPGTGGGEQPAPTFAPAPAPRPVETVAPVPVPSPRPVETVAPVPSPRPVVTVAPVPSPRPVVTVAPVPSPAPPAPKPDPVCVPSEFNPCN